MTVAVLALIAALSGMAETPAAPDPVPLAPIGPWTVNGDADGLCMLTRQYGTVDDPITVGFQSVPTQPIMEMLVLAKTGGGGSREGRASVTITPNGAPVHGDYLSFRVPRTAQRLIRFSIDRAAFDGLANATAMTLKADLSVTIAIRNPKPALAVLEQCQQKLLRAWGVDPASVAPGLPSPVALRGGPARWFTPDEYPPEALRAGVSGRVVMVLRIGDDGHVKDCRVVFSGGPILDSASCRIAMTRGVYSPVKDATGNPVESWSLVPVRWYTP